MEQIQAGGETRVRGRLQVWIWLQVLCNGGMALGLSLLYLLDLGSADLPLVFRWVSDIQHSAVLQCPSLQAPLPRLLAGRGDTWAGQ